MMNEKVDLEFDTISQALRLVNFPYVELVIGVAEGGVVPASLIAHQLNLPLQLLKINYRAADNSPQGPEPTLLLEPPALPDQRRILLVDDVSVSGKTLELARSILKNNQVITFTLKGQADIVLFPDISACVNWPWKINS